MSGTPSVTYRAPKEEPRSADASEPAPPSVVKEERMMKDLPVYPSLEAAVASCFGSRVRIVRTVPVTGGVISDAACVHISGGARVFVKSNAARAGERFSAEAAGLAAIASTGTVGTPRLLCLGVDEEKDRSFLMMEMAGGGKRSLDYWERLGRELAGLHGADTAAFLTGGRYGFPRDNFIGSNRQINEAKTSWVEFFRTCRLEPQFRMALRYFEPGMRPKIRRLLDFTARPRDVADPWYSDDFETAYRDILEGCQALLDTLERKNKEDF